MDRACVDRDPELGAGCTGCRSGSFADVPAGTKIGNLYATDIAAVWDGAVVPSYNIGGRTAVVLQDLADYGFLVEWTPGDGVNGGRVSVTTQALPETLPSYIPEETAASRYCGGLYLCHGYFRGSKWSFHPCV